MAANVVRDFIPAGERRTAVEKSRQEFLRGNGSGAMADFVPSKDHVLAPPSGVDAQFEEAMKRAMDAQASAARGEWEAGVEKLKKLNVAQTIEAIQQAPYSVMEMLLCIESQVGQRKSVLDRFPAVDPEKVKHWQEILNGAPNEASPAAPEGMAGDAKD